MGREISKTVSQTFLNIYCLSFCLFHLHCHTIWFRAIEFSTVGDHWQGMFSGGLQLRHRHSFPRLLYHLYYPFTVFRWFFMFNVFNFISLATCRSNIFNLTLVKSDKEMGLLTYIHLQWKSDSFCRDDKGEPLGIGIPSYLLPMLILNNAERGKVETFQCYCYYCYCYYYYFHFLFNPS